MLSDNHLLPGTLSDLMADTTIASFFIRVVLISTINTEKLSFHRGKKKLEVIKESGFKNFGFSNCSSIFKTTHTVQEKNQRALSLGRCRGRSPFGWIVC